MFSSIGFPRIYDAEKVLVLPILCLTIKISKSTKPVTISTILFLCIYFNGLNGLYICFLETPLVWKWNLDVSL